MTKPRTARNVYVRAMVANGVSEGVLMYVMASALREAETRKKKPFLDMAEAAVSYVQGCAGGGDVPTVQKALEDIAGGDDPRDVQVDILETVLAAMDELLADGDDSTHWTKQAVRNRIAAFLGMLVAGKGAAANGNVVPLEPPPNLPKDVLHGYRILGQTITLARGILREYRRDGDAAVEGLVRVMEAHKRAAVERAEIAVRAFIEAAGADLQFILIGVESKSPDGTSRVVLRKGPPTAVEADLCAAKIREGWGRTANSFVAGCPVVRLPELTSIAPGIPGVLPEGATPNLGRWDRFKMGLRFIGVKAGFIFIGAGLAAALACGVDLSSLATLGSFGINPGSGTGIGLSSIGASWMAWAAATGVDARHELKASFLKELEGRTADLAAKLTAAYNDSADATVRALREIKDEEIRLEAGIIVRIAETANSLSKEVEPRLLPNDAIQLRRRA